MASQSAFTDILERAEKLHTNVRLGDASEFLIPPANVEQDAPLLAHDLADIFYKSEEIWARKKSLKSVNQLSLKTTKDVSQLFATSISTKSFMESSTKNASQQQDLYETPSTSANDDLTMKEENEVEKYVEKSFERARIEMERSFLNQQILKQSRQHSFVSNQPIKGAKSTESPMSIKQKTGSSTALEFQQMIFAQKVDSALSKDCNAILTDSLREAVKKINNSETNAIWGEIFAVCSRPMIKPTEDIREFRLSKKWFEHVISASVDHLQDQFCNHMEAVIEANLAKARRGGIPGTITLVEAYLNVKQTSQHIFEDGRYENTSHPKWTVLFYCLRIGDFHVASSVAATLFNVTQCSTLIKIIANFTNSPQIDPETKVKLRAEWKQNAAGCQDPYKRAIYGLLLGFECHSVNVNIEDWLWARLFTCKLYPPELAKSFRQLQLTICVELGEKYFVSEAGSYLLYFSALLLTGQLEQAVRVLLHANYKTHAVHLAILAYQHRLLVTSDKVSSDILTTDVHDATICQLNLARIVLLYVKDFELSDVNCALNYCFFLRKFELDALVDGRGGRNVFESCVSRIVYLSGEQDLILGKLDARGVRLHGLIDKFSSAVNISHVISRVASDTNICGDPLTACHLYALANCPKDAIALISHRLATCISTPKTESAQKTIRCAKWLAERYPMGQESAEVSDMNLSALHLLTELYNFFSLAADGRHDQALATIGVLRLIPLDPEEVHAYVHAFQMVPDEVRPLLPEICTTLMRSITTLHSAQPADSPVIPMLKNYAGAVVLYTAMVPYRFPLSANSILLQLQSKIV